MDRFAFQKQSRGRWKRIHRTTLLAETDDAALRLDDVQELEHRRGRGWTIVACAVNFSVVDSEGRQVAAIVRYDASHGFAHRDELFRDPPEKVRLATSSLAEFRRMALEDLKSNWRGYLEQYASTYGQVL